MSAAGACAALGFYKKNKKEKFVYNIFIIAYCREPKKTKKQ
jgi:hypothetical protein